MATTMGALRPVVILFQVGVLPMWMLYVVVATVVIFIATILITRFRVAVVKEGQPMGMFSEALKDSDGKADAKENPTKRPQTFGELAAQQDIRPLTGAGAAGYSTANVAAVAGAFLRAQTELGQYEAQLKQMAAASGRPLAIGFGSTLVVVSAEGITTLPLIDATKTA